MTLPMSVKQQVTPEKTRVYWSKLMQVKFNKNAKDKMFLKYNYSDLDWKAVQIVDSTRSTRGNNVDSQFSLEQLPRLYDTVPGINTDKQSSLLALCDSGKINMRFHDFYKNLPLHCLLKTE